MRTYSIVGMNHIETEEIVAALEPGTPVTLVREPANQHDKNAIAVWANGQRVGYIPKKQNLVLAQFIDQNGDVAQVGGFALDGKMIEGPFGKQISATFVRSPNSQYPMVQV